MTHLSPSRVATILDQTAGLLAQHGTDTTRRVHELSLAAGSTSDGRSSKGDHSDPTYRQAMTTDDLARLEPAWHALHARLWAVWTPRVPDTAMSRLGGSGGPWAVHACRQLAARIRTHHTTPLAELLDIAQRIQGVIYDAAPIDREAAAELLREQDYLAMRAKDCDACESPTPELRSGYCDACRKRIGRWTQLHPGETFDRTAFKQMICTDIATGLITRPASPHSPITKQRTHEDDAA